MNVIRRSDAVVAMGEKRQQIEGLISALYMDLAADWIASSKLLALSMV